MGFNQLGWKSLIHNILRPAIIRRMYILFISCISSASRRSRIVGISQGDEWTKVLPAFIKHFWCYSARKNDSCIYFLFPLLGLDTSKQLKSHIILNGLIFFCGKIPARRFSAVLEIAKSDKECIASLNRDTAATNEPRDKDQDAETSQVNGWAAHSRPHNSRHKAADQGPGIHSALNNTLCQSGAKEIEIIEWIKWENLNLEKAKADFANTLRRTPAACGCISAVCLAAARYARAFISRLLPSGVTGKPERGSAKRHLSSDNSIPIHTLPYAASIMIIARAK